MEDIVILGAARTAIGSELWASFTSVIPSGERQISIRVGGGA